MSSIKNELIEYGKKIYDAHLVVGCGGNISVRDGDGVWMKPSGLALYELGEDDLCGMNLETGEQVAGDLKPTSEVNMHLGIYRVRPDVTAVFHTHSPWLCGVVSAGIDLSKKVMFAEFINDLGGRATVPYVTPTTQELADLMCEAAKEADSIFMTNHGFCGLGTTMKQAFFRCLVVEDACQSLVAATIVGKPQLLKPKQEEDLMALSGPQHRVKMMESE
ncbi:MAG: class II aldolase/adducin family protein [Candidatus Nealsonbacteria bacterium]|nr:class II aldolase/adducin family protein [Candidatus Nealsonbacteria bacterium]